MKRLSSVQLTVLCGGLALIGGLTLLYPRLASAQEKKFPAEKLAQVRKLLTDTCARCHSNAQGKLAGTVAIDDYASYFAGREGKTPYITKGDPTKSYFYRKIKSGSMPEGGPEFTAAQRALIEEWINCGADDYHEGAGKTPVKVEKDKKGETEPKVAPREEGPRGYVEMGEVLRAIRDHQSREEKEDRPFVRYFTFTNLHNDPRVSNEMLRRARAALVKAINSMSWKRGMLHPRPIDKNAVVYAIDIRDLDWDRQKNPFTHVMEKETRWATMLSLYPYGLRYHEQDDRDTANLDKDIYLDGGRELVYIRADWFIAMATRPPLYHDILRLPDNAVDLEKKLGVDIPTNFRRNRLARAGFQRSGISEQNRLIERHEALYGAYWKSYDFLRKADKSNLQQFPLGPDFTGNYGGQKFPYLDVTFNHDGGEMIFNLPNGLQGYYLVDGKDRRLNAGPTEVVFDPTKFSGTLDIVTGLSCIACHKKGMIYPPLRDYVRDGNALDGEARLKVRKLYPPWDVDKDIKRDDAKGTMVALMKKDEKLFMDALKEAVGPYLLSPDMTEDQISEALDREPVAEVALRYAKDMDVATVASELGYKSLEEFKGAIKGNPKIRALGLGSLALKDGVIKRAEWEKFDGFTLMQRTAHTLEIALPHK
jgi:serine/threonine-protein kinase